MTHPQHPVGYGRPPEHTRFQKGQSGNPSGKPGPKKRLKHAFDAALSEALNADKEALLQAKPVRVIDVLARQLAVDALDGQTAARKLLLSILEGEDRNAADEERARMDRAAEDSAKREEINRRIKETMKNVTEEQARAICEELRREESFPDAGKKAGNEKNNGEPERGAAVQTGGRAAGEQGEEEAVDDDAESEDEEPFVFDDETARAQYGERYDEFKTRFERAMKKGAIDDLVNLAADFDDA